jgi:hypothetical protein
MLQCWDIEQLGQIADYVCADIVLDSYYAAGINLQQLLLTSVVNDGRWQVPEAAVHNAQAYGQYLKAYGQLRGADAYPYYQGEILLGYPQWEHSAVVVEGGYDENSVRLVQASYTTYKIEEITLHEWKWRENRMGEVVGPGAAVWHGHPSEEELDRLASLP